MAKSLGGESVPERASRSGTTLGPDDGPTGDLAQTKGTEGFEPLTAGAVQGTISSGSVQRLSLPIKEYAVLVPTEITRSAIVVTDSATLPNAGKIPFQVFPALDFLESEIPSEATPGELKRLGLEKVFSADPSARVTAMRFADDDSTEGFLICKLLPEDSADHVRTLCYRKAQDIRNLIKQSHALAAAYEREILGIVFHPLLPVVVTDQDRKIVAANAMLCGLAGRSHADLVGRDLFSIFHLESDLVIDPAPYPESTAMTTPLYIKTQALFFVSELRISKAHTTCGERSVFTFQDLLTDQRTSNSNIQLVQKLSSIIMDDAHPQTIIRRVNNILASTLDCDLVCIVRRKQNDEMIVMPHLNRSLKTLRANLIIPDNEPVLEPFFSNGTPVLCTDVESTCPQDSFFRQILKISRFAFIPAGHGTKPEYALLMAWCQHTSGIGPKALPLFRVIANLLGTVLVRSSLVSEMDQEKDILRRYTRLTAGREMRMAELKRENAQLRELIMKLSGESEE